MIRISVDLRMSNMRGVDELQSVGEQASGNAAKKMKQQRR